MKKITHLDRILIEGEDEYLDNGGAMTIERRDHYFTRVINYARRLETRIRKMDYVKNKNSNR